jgi:predicted membrane protein
MSFTSGFFFVVACVVLLGLLFLAARLLFRFLFVALAIIFVIYGLYSYSLLPEPLEEKVQNIILSEPVQSAIAVVKGWWKGESPREKDVKNSDEVDAEPTASN